MQSHGGSSPTGLSPSNEMGCSGIAIVLGGRTVRSQAQDRAASVRVGSSGRNSANRSFVNAPRGVT